MDDCDFAVEGEMWVRILFAGGAVRRPARVADGCVKNICGEYCPKPCHASGCLKNFNIVVANDSDACAVVATVFESLESVEHDVDSILFSGIADNSAHSINI